jgi:hypothetical protein
MMIKTRTTGKWLLTAVLPIVLGGMLTGCAREEAVSYSQQVKPIMEGGAGYEASGFSMATYDDLMKGTEFGPMIISGDSAGSNMIVLMEGRADPSISMPHGSLDPIRQAEIETVRLWIDQGAKNN